MSAIEGWLVILPVEVLRLNPPAIIVIELPSSLWNLQSPVPALLERSMNAIPPTSSSVMTVSSSPSRKVTCPSARVDVRTSAQSVHEP